MRKKIINTTIIIITLVVGALLHTLNNIDVSAAGRALAMSPMSQKVLLSPGETYHGGFTIANPAAATEELNYIVTIGSYFPTSGEKSNDDYGDIDITTVTNMNMIMDWIEIINPTGTIQPNGSTLVEFTINVPENAPAGGQYASLLAKENPDANRIDKSVSVNEIMQMAHIIYAEVAGETIEKGEIAENSIPSFLLNNQLKATSFVKNNGNVHTEAEYTLQVWPIFSDEEICTNEEDPETSLVLPDTERYHAQNCQLPLIGIFRAKQTVKIFGETSIVEKTIIVCPIWLLFLIIFAIAAIIIYFVTRAKSRRGNRKLETE